MQYQELFITENAKKSCNTACLYKSKTQYIVVDYMEINEYLKKGFKKSPLDFDDEDIPEVTKTNDLKVKIDAAELLLREKQKELDSIELIQKENLKYRDQKIAEKTLEEVKKKVNKSK